jgi:hypothetical protein
VNVIDGVSVDFPLAQLPPSWLTPTAEIVKPRRHRGIE